MEDMEGTEVWPAEMVRVTEVMDRLGVKEAKAYNIIRSLNRELKSSGFITVSGRVPRRYFEERTYLRGGEREA